MSAPFRFGPFYLDSRIAVGGTAEVYLARPALPDSGLPEKLVVKRLLPHFASDPEGRTMFEREATLHAAVTHANVVTVFHAGVDTRGEPYLAMEYIDGVDVYRLLRRFRHEGRLPPVYISIHVIVEILNPYDGETRLSKAVMDMSATGMSLSTTFDSQLFKAETFLPSLRVMIDGELYTQTRGRVVYNRKLLDLSGQLRTQVGIKFEGQAP